MTNSHQLSTQGTVQNPESFRAALKETLICSLCRADRAENQSHNAVSIARLLFKAPPSQGPDKEGVGH